MKLSVVITAYNEELILKECLDSVQRLADEVIVVNSSSTDNTLSIAKKMGAKVFTQPNNLMLNVNKNFGFTKAKSEWVLSLDADERVTEELAREIRQVVKEQGSSINGYWIPRKNYIFGKWIQSDMWWPDFQLRLFRQNKGKFPEKHVHEYLVVEGKTDKLKEALVHNNYTSVSQYLRKMDTIYTESEVQKILSEQRKLHWLEAIRFPARDFLKTFFLQRGYKDGLHGLVLSILQAFYAEVVFAKVWEKQGFPQEDNKSFLSSLNREFHRLRYEIRYWFLTILIEESKSIVKKTLFRIMRKRIMNKLDSVGKYEK